MVQRVFRTDFLWGQTSNDTLVCIKFHESVPKKAEQNSKGDVARSDYFTVVSRVTGVLKGRKILSFAFRNNLVFLTCKEEPNLFIFAFGVPIMSSIKTLAATSNKNNSPTTPPTLRKIEDFDDFQHDSDHS